MEGERIVMWEKFLPRQSIRVLVVEGDDSTRQILSALLRNCSYQVTAVGDGLLAWGLLDDPSNCFDLVLTEVAMTSLSGFNLLCKIMSHESLKHISVIMMSSFDSMSVVFKCLTNGAADFLVKPVRKNELQNLWQHVWRRCHNSSCSGSGRHNQNAAQSKNEAGYDNNTSSIGESENASSGLDIREGSDNGSGTQGSWTNQHEVESSHQRSKWKQLGYYGSKFDEGKQVKKEKIQNNWMHSVATSVKAFDDAIVQDLVIPVPGRVSTHVECLQEESIFHNQSCQNKEVDCSTSCGECDCLGSESVKEGSEPSIKAIDLIGNMGSEPNCRNGDQEDGRSGEGKTDTRINCCHRKDKFLTGYNCMPELELTLNRPQGSEPSIKAIDLIGNMGSEPNCRNGDQEDCRSGEGKTDTRVNCCHRKDKFLTDYNCMPELELTLNRPQGNWNEYSKLKDKCTLRQSDASAFSRYDTGGTHLSFPVNLYPKKREQYCVSSKNMGSLHLTVPFEQLGCSRQSGGDASDQYQLSQHNNNQDRGSSIIAPSGQAACPSSVPMQDDTPVSLPMGVAMPITRGIISFNGAPPSHGTSLHPMFYSYPGAPIRGADTALEAEREDACDSYYHELHCVSLPDHSHHYSHLHHHHIQYHHHHHHHHDDEGHAHKKHARQVECAVDNSATTDQDGSYIMPRNTFDSNCGESGSSNGHRSNGNADRSASASNNDRINVLTGKSSVAVISGANGASGPSNTLTSTTGNGVENNRSAHREAALMNFRRKRKERCFEKSFDIKVEKCLQNNGLE